ncbi:MAG: hypothetical protein LBK52_05265, partial [Deltaproteobacteria bacterium]|nr:hypothetical protein [Deltaproteobacteria bacterium]
MKPCGGYFIYQYKGEGQEYALFSLYQNTSGRKINHRVWLGRVVDKNKNIFCNRTDGYFTFIPPNEKIKLTENQIKDIEDVNKRPDLIVTQTPKYINFGDIYVFNEFIKSSGFYLFFQKILPGDSQSLFALILFKLLEKEPYAYAQVWWQSSYARYLFPGARLDPEHVR